MSKQVLLFVFVSNHWKQCCIFLGVHKWFLLIVCSLQPPEYMPENLSKFSAWVGGAIIAKVVFPQNQHVTKADYDETGPSIVHRKCY